MQYHAWRNSQAQCCYSSCAPGPTRAGSVLSPVSMCRNVGTCAPVQKQCFGCQAMSACRQLAPAVLGLTLHDHMHILGVGLFQMLRAMRVEHQWLQVKRGESSTDVRSYYSV